MDNIGTTAASDAPRRRRCRVVEDQDAQRKSRKVARPMGLGRRPDNRRHARREQKPTRIIPSDLVNAAAPRKMPAWIAADRPRVSSQRPNSSTPQRRNAAIGTSAESRTDQRSLQSNKSAPESTAARARPARRIWGFQIAAALPPKPRRARRQRRRTSASILDPQRRRPANRFAPPATALTTDSPD